jgi:hypothetical protein
MVFMKIEETDLDGLVYWLIFIEKLIFFQNYLI